MDLRNLLRSLSDEGTTILISSHILTELEGFCTSIGLMEKGQMIRSGTIAAISAAETPLRVVRLGWVGAAEALVRSHLEASPHISGITIQGEQAIFKFDGSDEELAGVLAGVVAAGVKVLNFGEVKQTVEDIYLKLSHNEVM
jgi:ABC-2 type transport system ATP-binding protein